MATEVAGLEVAVVAAVEDDAKHLVSHHSHTPEVHAGRHSCHCKTTIALCPPSDAAIFHTAPSQTVS